jgi:predicted ATP-binding protein involved in virulence
MKAELLEPLPELHVESVSIRNVRGIASLDLRFDHRLTVLIGENGAGKTTVLTSLAAAHLPASAAPTHRRVRGHSLEAPTTVEAALKNGGRIRCELTHRWKVRLHSDLRVLPYLTDRTHRSFGDMVDWFLEKDIEEARKIRDTQDLSYRHPQLQSVREAVARMIRGASNLRVEPESKELIVDYDDGSGVQPLRVEELAGGYRTMLALVADLAMRMLDGKPALVLIDEVDLHLHPKWQLNVVEDLLTTFPKAQFILTTHSEQIVASVPTQCVIALQNTQDGVVARTLPPVEGAAFDRVLEDAMGLPARRPPAVQKMLDDYFALIDAGEGESDAAKALRSALDALFQGLEPELVRADQAIRRMRVTRGRAGG